MSNEISRRISLKRIARRVNARIVKDPTANLTDVLHEVAQDYGLTGGALTLRFHRAHYQTLHQIIPPGEKQ